MPINAAGLALIKKLEGCKLVAYPDPILGTTRWTIGYGQTKGVKQGMIWTQQQADDDLIATTNEISQQVETIGKLVGFKLNDNQIAALTSFTYNLGFFNLLRLFVGSCLPNEELNAKKITTKMLDYDHSNGKMIPGLLTRRLAEGTLFLS